MYAESITLPSRQNVQSGTQNYQASPQLKIVFANIAQIFQQGTVMEIKANRVNHANATISAILAKELLEKKVEKIARQTSKNMKIDGFRKGKIPLTIVKQRYGDQLEKDAQGEMLRDVLQKGLDEMKISNEEVIGDPSVQKYDDAGEEIEVELKVGLKPDIEPGDYHAMVPDFQVPEVNDEDVEARIQEIAESQVPYENMKTKRQIKNDDLVLLDFEGVVDGKPLEGGSAQEYTLKIGSGSFIPGFEDQIVGMKPGEEGEINVTFPEDYNNKEIAGKAATFNIKVHAIQKKSEVAIDDELAKKLLPNEKEATLDTLKEKIKDQLKNEKKISLYNDDLKPKILESLAEKVVFDLPDFVVEQEIDMAFRNALSQLEEKELEEIKSDPEKAKESREKYRADAEKSVKVTFIIDAIARKEGIDVTENELLQTIYMEAMQSGQNPQEMVKFYQSRGLLPAIKMSMVEDKLLTHLLEYKLNGGEKKEEAAS